MRHATWTLILALTPAAVAAQASGQAKGSVTAGGSAQTRNGSVQAGASANVNADARGEYHAPKEFSAEGRAKLEAMYEEAATAKLPREPMARRVNEGRAKGATEAQVIAQAGVVRGNMQATQEAILIAGRKSASPEEIDRGSQAMERGVTKAQIGLLARKMPSDRSLVVAFDVLTRLTARGVTPGRAITQISSRIDANATDAQIGALASAGVAGSAGAMGGMTGSAAAGATGTAAAAGNAAAAGTKGAVGATVTGAVGTVIKKP